MDQPKSDTPKQVPLPNTPEFERFADLAAKLFAVPKAELDALEAEYQATKPTRARRSQRPGA